MNYSELIQLLHGGRNPYEGFDVQKWKREGPNWGSRHPWVQESIIRRPSLIIEVGSLLGGSAINMATKAKELSLDTVIICVDSWLGGFDHNSHTLGPQEWRGWEFGHPTVYYSFLANVIDAGMQDMIIPMPADSLNAARYLRHHGVKADMIYIDASHDEGDCFRDMMMYWPLLNSNGGMMMVDDYHETDFPGVFHDVNQFSAMFDVPIDRNVEKARLFK